MAAAAGYCESRGCLAGVEREQHARMIGIDEGNRLDAPGAAVRRYARCAHRDEAAGMAQRVIFRIAGYCAGPAVDRDDATAIAAAAEMGAETLVEREVPHQHAACPVAGAADHEGTDRPRPAVGPRLRPFAARAFGEEYVLGGISVTHLTLDADLAIVAMPRDSGDVAARRRVGEYAERLRGLVPIVIPFEDARPEPRARELRTEMVADDPCALRRAQPHAGIVFGLEIGLVLDA